VFDEELYVGMKYEAPIPYFHMFEIDGTIAGLDFVSEKAAEQFWAKVQQWIPKSATTPSMAPLPEQKNHMEMSKTKSGFGQIKSLLGMEEEINVKASVISKPTNVKHLQHIGYDPDKGFQVENIPPEWKAFFKSAGIKAKDLQDPETAKQVMNVMESYAANNDLSAPPPAPPAPGAPAAPPAGRSAPPPPARRGAPAPAASPAAGKAPPAPAAPAAPAPPPPPAAPAAPAPPPAPAAGGGSKKGPPAPARGDLLSEIQNGRNLVKLKPVDNSSDAGNASSGPGGAKAPAPSKAPASSGDDLQSALQKVMAARRQAVQDTHAEEEEDDW
jgi:hypothetical protein